MRHRLTRRIDCGIERNCWLREMTDGTHCPACEERTRCNAMILERLCELEDEAERRELAAAPPDVGTVGERLRALRGKQTQQEVAAAVKVSYKSISAYECGKKVPSDKVKLRLAAYFGVTVSDIFYAPTDGTAVVAVLDVLQQLLRQQGDLSQTQEQNLTDIRTAYARLAVLLDGKQ